MDRVVGRPVADPGVAQPQRPPRGEEDGMGQIRFGWEVGVGLVREVELTWAGCTDSLSLTLTGETRE